MAGDGTFSNASNSPIVLALEESVLDLSGNGTVTGAIQLDGCTLKASGSPTISGNITQSDNATIEILSNKTLSYSGASLSLGGNKLTIIGGGNLNNSNPLIMGDADSLLVLDGITTIKDVKATTSANSGKGIKVIESAALGIMDLSATSYLDIAANQTLGGQINLLNNADLIISGSGEYTGNIALAGGRFSVLNNKDLTGSLSLSANSVLNVPQGTALVINQSGNLQLNEKKLVFS